MEHTASQRIAILGHLEQHGTITTLQAIKLYDCTRLSGRIHELRQDYRIGGKWITVGTRKKQVMEYRLIGKKEGQAV